MSPRGVLDESHRNDAKAEDPQDLGPHSQIRRDGAAKPHHLGPLYGGPDVGNRKGGHWARACEKLPRRCKGILQAVVSVQAVEHGRIVQRTQEPHNRAHGNRSARQGCNHAPHPAVQEADTSQEEHEEGHGRSRNGGCQRPTDGMMHSVGPASSGENPDESL